MGAIDRVCLDLVVIMNDDDNDDDDVNGIISIHILHYTFGE